MFDATNRLVSLSKIACVRRLNITFLRTHQLFTSIISSPGNFSPQTLTGAEFEDRISSTKLLELVHAYETVWQSDSQPATLQDGTYNLDDRVQSDIIKVVAQRAHYFLPMIRAMFAAGYVDHGHRVFELKYRFQSIRHSAASAWHMDNGIYQTYADDGDKAKRWTESRTRKLVTSACINMNGSVHPSLWHNCGTNVAIGMPVLRPDLLNALMQSISDEVKEKDFANTCDELMLHRRVTSDLQRATEIGIQDYTKAGGKLSHAGVQNVTLENGVISDYNDFMFHQSNTDVPDGYKRVFFVLSGVPTDIRGKPRAYNVDSTIHDDRNGQTYQITVVSI